MARLPDQDPLASLYYRAHITDPCAVCQKPHHTMKVLRLSNGQRVRYLMVCEPCLGHLSPDQKAVLNELLEDEEGV